MKHPLYGDKLRSDNLLINLRGRLWRNLEVNLRGIFEGRAYSSLRRTIFTFLGDQLWERLHVHHDKERP